MTTNKTDGMYRYRLVHDTGIILRWLDIDSPPEPDKWSLPHRVGNIEVAQWHDFMFGISYRARASSPTIRTLIYIRASLVNNQEVILSFNEYKDDNPCIFVDYCNECGTHL